MESSIPHTALIVDATGIVGQNLANRLVAEGWTVHRPHTIIGHAIGNVMNMGSTLAVYASICRETGRPFVFPGSPTQWSGLTDVTDARQLASQIHWAAPYPGHATSLENVLSADAPSGPTSRPGTDCAKTRSIAWPSPGTPAPNSAARSNA